MFVLVGGVLFVGFYVLIVVVFNYFYLNGCFFGVGLNEFFNVFCSVYFLVVVGLFLVLMIIMVLLLNWVGWWVYVFGSLVLVIVVYFVVIGGLLFIGNILYYLLDLFIFVDFVVFFWVIVSVVVVCEVLIWIGLGILVCGCWVKVCNVEVCVVFDCE